MSELGGFQPRWHQQEMMERVKQKAREGDRTIVANVFPGSGKTWAYQTAAAMLLERGVIDSVVVLVPRLNLAEQCDRDSAALRQMLGNASRFSISHRLNEPPLFRHDPDTGQMATGYATTYSSLIANPALHFDALRGRRFLLVADEAQQLGVSDEGGTRSARYVEDLGERAAFRILLSGTPVRSDGNPLLWATYDDPDDRGIRRLLADVEATYRQGVAQKYLRPFDFTLVDGRATWRTSTEETKELQLSSMADGMRKVIWHPDFYEPTIDRFIEALRDQQTIDRRFCGLVAAGTIAQARDIDGYLKRRHGSIRSLIATSDDSGAQANLREFRRGRHDVLVTVQMAYVGYDYKWIGTVCVLQDIRWHGYLAQLFARGLRVTPDLPFHLQTMRAIVPHDLPMEGFCEGMREESREGLRDQSRRERDETCEPEPAERQVELGYTESVELTGAAVIGYSPDGDVAQDEYEAVDRMQRKYGVHGPMSGFVRLMRDYGIAMPASAQAAAVVTAAPIPERTAADREKTARSERSKLASRADRILINAGYPQAAPGFTNKQLILTFDKRVERLSLSELLDQIAWLQKEWLPFCEQYDRNQSAIRHG